MQLLQKKPVTPKTIAGIGSTTRTRAKNGNVLIQIKNGKASPSQIWSCQINLPQINRMPNQISLIQAPNHETKVSLDLPMRIWKTKTTKMRDRWSWTNARMRLLMRELKNSNIFLRFVRVSKTKPMVECLTQVLHVIRPIFNIDSSNTKHIVPQTKLPTAREFEVKEKATFWSLLMGLQFEWPMSYMSLN